MGRAHREPSDGMSSRDWYPNDDLSVCLILLPTLQDLDTNAESPITAIASDSGSSSTFLASFADGVVKIFDRRYEEDDAVVRSYHQHTSWVQNVKWHPTLAEQFLTGRYETTVALAAHSSLGTDVP